MSWYNPDRGFWYYLPPSDYKYKPGFACFDLDWTLVRPSRGKFPANPSDNVIMNGRIDVLRDLYDKGYNIVIFTNQKLTPQHNLEYKLTRMNDIITKFKQEGINLLLFMSILDDKYRKPNVGMWEYLVEIFRGQITTAYTFYCGDAAGRPGDHSSDDIDFAKNIGIMFYTPEELFQK